MFRILTIGLCAVLTSSANAEVRWFSLASENAEEASKFYAGLFGWTMERGPNGDYRGYRDGVPMAGISQIDEDVEGVEESQWVPAILVADVARAQSTAERLGAQIVTPTTYTPEWGTFALLTDPQAAPFIIANVERNIAGLTAPGAWVWAELWAKDVNAAVRFYGAVLDYDMTEVDGKPVFTMDGTPQASIIAIEQDFIEQGWAPYIGVASLAQTLEQAEELGGEIVLQPGKDFADGRAALILDSTGAGFFVYELREAE